MQALKYKKNIKISEIIAIVCAGIQICLIYKEVEVSSSTKVSLGMSKDKQDIYLNSIILDHLNQHFASLTVLLDNSVSPKQ